MKNIVKLINNEEGQGMIEYGLIIALVAVVAIVGLKLLGPQIQKMFEGISDDLKPVAT